jgi:hypothetical protein
MDKETTKFLENKFGVVEQRLIAIDGRLDTMDGRFTDIDGKFEETRRYFGVLAEGLRSEIRQVAEGHHILLDARPASWGRLSTWSTN